MTKDTSVCRTPIHLSEVIITTQNQHTRTIAAREVDRVPLGFTLGGREPLLEIVKRVLVPTLVQFDAFRIIHSGGDETEVRH